MQKLMEKCSDRVEVRIDLNPLKWDENKKAPPEEYLKMLEDGEMENIEWADVVFTQNISNFGPQYMIDLLKASKQRDKFFHYDTDDLLTGLYEGHRLVDVYKKNKLDELTKVLYANADLVSVTQRKFADRISSFVQNSLVVIKNAIDYNLPCWTIPKPRMKKKDPLKIGWVGGIHHEQDVKQIPIVAMGVNSKVGPENVRWGFYGRPVMPMENGVPKPDWQQDVWDSYERILTKGTKHRNWMVYNALPSHEYGRMFSNIDLAIAPLEWNEFNDSKSEIKAMECGRYGIPLVATDCGCYDEIIKNGETGYLISKNNPRQEWIRILSKCIKDKKHVEEMGRNLKQLTDERFDINNHIEARLGLYSHLMNHDEN
jgi:glycosyltransferase involved in cell wall biosynthesis